MLKKRMEGQERVCRWLCSESEIRRGYHEGHVSQTLGPGRPSGVENVGLRWGGMFFGASPDSANGWAGEEEGKEYIECQDEDEKADGYERAEVPY